MRDLAQGMRLGDIGRGLFVRRKIRDSWFSGLELLHDSFSNRRLPWPANLHDIIFSKTVEIDRDKFLKACTFFGLETVTNAFQELVRDPLNGLSDEEMKLLLMFFSRLDGMPGKGFSRTTVQSTLRKDKSADNITCLKTLNLPKDVTKDISKRKLVLVTTEYRGFQKQ